MNDEKNRIKINNPRTFLLKADDFFDVWIVLYEQLQKWENPFSEKISINFCPKAGKVFIEMKKRRSAIVKVVKTPTKSYKVAESFVNNFCKVYNFTFVEKKEVKDIFSFIISTKE